MSASTLTAEQLARARERPAFPHSALLPDGPTMYTDSEGMTLRDWFATHAPTEIPAWFTHGDDLPPLPGVLYAEVTLEQQTGYAGLSEPDKEHLRQWLMDGSWDLDDHLEAIGNAANSAITQSRQDRDNAAQQRKADRYIAWRWHYADMMIRSRQQ